MIRNTLVDLIENTFRHEEALYLACNEERAFFASEEYQKYDKWFCQKVTDALIYLEMGFMKSPTKEKRYDLINAFNSTSRYLDDLLNIDNIHFEHMVHRIYPSELQLNKANASDTEAASLDLNLSINNDIRGGFNI